MHFRRRPSSPAAYGSDSPRAEGDHGPDLHGTGDDTPASYPAAAQAHRLRPTSMQPIARGRDIPSGFEDPTWGQPPSMPSAVRFTRTPDRVLKERRRQAAGRFPAEEAVPAMEAVQAPRPTGPPLPRPSPPMLRS